MGERVFYEIAEIYLRASDYRFAVIAIYPDRPNEDGCIGVVKSLHFDRADAETVRATLTDTKGDRPMGDR